MDRKPALPLAERAHGQATLVVVLRAATVLLGISLFGICLLFVTPEPRGWLIERLSPRRGFSLGDRVTLTPLEAPKDKAAGVLVVSSSCRYCEDAIPLFHELLTEMVGRGLHVVTFGADSGAVLPEYGRRHRLGHVLPLDTERIRVPRVPTLLLLDRAGSVVDLVEGVPTAAALAHVREKLASLR